MRLVALAAVLAVVSCGSRRATDVPAPTARVIVETAAGARHVVRVEVARTEPERRQGLMKRESLPQDAGMLFLFDETAQHSFWMKDTLIPLDMIFIDEEGRIVGVVENAAPHTLTARMVLAPSRYVLEVNGGWSRAHGVAAGDRVKFENVQRF